jgi:hypothetical protein
MPRSSSQHSSIFVSRATKTRGATVSSDAEHPLKSRLATRKATKIAVLLAIAIGQAGLLFAVVNVAAD